MNKDESRTQLAPQLVLDGYWQPVPIPANESNNLLPTRGFVGGGGGVVVVGGGGGAVVAVDLSQ